MRRPAILKQHDVPGAPVRTDHFQEILMSLFLPKLADKEQDRAGMDIKHAVQNPLGAIAADPDARLLATPPITAVERWRFGDDRFIQHQDDRSDTFGQATLEPPLDWRQVGEQRIRSWRGLFQTSSSRPSA